MRSLTSSRLQRSTVTLALLAGLSAPLLACGSDDGDAAVATTATPATAAAAAAAAAAMTAADTSAPSLATPGSTIPSSTAAGTEPSALAEAGAAAGLTEAEAAGLLWMREEEKLALDVYTTLGEQWGLTIFDNISDAEQSHTESVLTLLDAYNLPDPAAANATGVFTDPVLQAMYDDLVARGSRSIVDALQVGAAIEEIDIVDLQERASSTPAIAAVYDNLELGSRNHLRAFVSNLTQQGVTYQPEHLDIVAYEAIVTSPTERAGGR